MPRPLRPTDVPRRSRPQIARIDTDRLLVRGPHGVSLLRGIARDDLERVLAHIDGRRTAGEICELLADEYDREQVFHLLRRLAVPQGSAGKEPVEPAGRGDAGGDPVQPIVLGTGIASRRISELLALPRRDASAETVLERLQPRDLVIVALEDASYRRLFELQSLCLRAGATSLFVTVDPDGVRIGPTVVPGAGPCFACAQIASFRVLRLEAPDLISAVSGFSTGTADASTFERAARRVALETREVPAGRPELLTSVLLLAGGGATTYAVSPAATCPLCSPASRVPRDSPLADAARHELIESHRRAPRRAKVAAGGDLCSSVGIVGGGTAGYLTALALRRRFPRLEVTLIESSKLPIIGVGEATTPLMPQFLHVDLGLDVHELFRELRPTLKLGIRFDWGVAGQKEGGFNYPFGPLHVLEPAVYDRDSRWCSPQSALMSAGALPLRAAGGGWQSSLGVETAYHLDNESFVRYLRRKAADFGVRTVDARIRETRVAPDRESVTALVADDGRSFAFDLYVDCSGFRSLLMEQGLGSPFLSYSDSLFTDRALIASVPAEAGNETPPYTSAAAMNAGWCWSTPQREADHRGYVFCSDFATAEEAEREMRRANPGMGEARLIEFRAGRHQHFWHGNVVAMGNAYGFVEPLESTALHMLIRQIGLLLRSLPARRGERGVPALLNRRVGDLWDYLRWFLAIHYRFNRRIDTPFWRHCRSEVDVSAHAELIDAFRERGPLSYQRTGFDYPDPLWGAQGIDVLLLGQGVPTALPRPVVGRQDWHRRARLYRDFARRATPQAEALEVLDQQPELLDRWVEAFRRFGPAFG